MSIPAKTLNNGVKMPVIGLGVWKVKPSFIAERVVKDAISAGYRHIDTARIYLNEKGVGKAIKNSPVPREQLFITTKLWNDDQGYESALRAFDDSLKRLGLDYVDLYLLHWPVTGKRLDSWRALEEIYAGGRAKAIGVSNFTIAHLDELIKSSKVVPAVNQVEFHPFLFQKDLMDFCNKHGIALEAYSPLAHGERMDQPVISALAAKYKKTNAQVMLRWSVQRGNIVIPKTTHKERMTENLDIFDFEINDKDMKSLDGLNENYRTCWNPEEMK